MTKDYVGPERRKSVRLEYASPLDYKICKKETINKLLQGYTSNVSEAGILCNIKTRVNKDDILWLVFDRGILNICEDLERKVFIYQNGIIGKVVRIDPKEFDTFDVGVQFITREEPNLNNIYPEIYFLEPDKGSRKDETS